MQISRAYQQVRRRSWVLLTSRKTRKAVPHRRGPWLRPRQSAWPSGGWLTGQARHTPGSALGNLESSLPRASALTLSDTGMNRSCLSCSGHGCPMSLGHRNRYAVTLERVLEADGQHHSWFSKGCSSPSCLLFHALRGPATAGTHERPSGGCVAFPTRRGSARSVPITGTL